MEKSISILVTGSKGQLGSELKQIHQSFPEYHFIFTDVEELDLSNKELVFKYLETTQPEIILNCAAYTAVDVAESDAEKALILNGLAPSYLAEYAKKNNAFFIHISTDYVFDGTKTSPYVETDAVNPQSQYGKTKLKGEEFIINMNPNAVILRTSWLYSSFGNNFVKTILKIAKENKQIRVVNDQVGCPTWATDLAYAILQMVNQRDIIQGTHIFNYSNEGDCSWFEFAKKIVEISNITCEVIPITTKEFPRPAPRPAYSVFSKEKIQQTFGIKIPNWEVSLIKMLSLIR